MGYIEIKEYTTKNPLQMIGDLTGVCWSAKDKKSEANVKRAMNCIMQGHGRVEEFPDVYLVLSDYSARVIREWYTHVGGSPTRLQESTRYVDCENFKAVLPASIAKSSEASELYLDCMKSIRESYKKLAALDMPREDIANILPLGMCTKIVDKRNLRNLIDMSHQRMCSRAYWEYRQLFSDICVALRAYSEEWAWIVDNCFKPKCDIFSYCTEQKSCGRKPSKVIN